MLALWKHCFDNELRVEACDCIVLLSEMPKTDRSLRQKICQTFFEQIKAKGLFMQQSPVLGMYASGLMTGITLDIGEGTAHAVPVYEGFAFPHAIRRLDFSGKDMTDLLYQKIKKTEPEFVQDFDILRDIKEKLCYCKTN